MSSLLTSTLAPASAQTRPFILLQSSTAQSCIDTLRYTIREAISKSDGCTVLFSLLYPPSTLLEQNQLSLDRLQVLDWTPKVPGYTEDGFDIRADMFAKVSAGASGY